MARRVRIKREYGVGSKYQVGDHLSVGWFIEADRLSIRLGDGQVVLLEGTNELGRKITDAAINAGAKIVKVEPPDVIIVECNLPPIPNIKMEHGTLMGTGLVRQYLHQLQALATQAQLGTSVSDTEIAELVSRFDEHAAHLRDGSDHAPLLRSAIGSLKSEVLALAPDPRLGGTIEEQERLVAPRVAVLQRAVELITERLQTLPGA